LKYLYFLYNNELFWVFIITVYALAVTVFTKYPYRWMREVGLEKNVSVYYNRKIVHMFAGGVALFAVPFVFTDGKFPFPYIYPLIVGSSLAILTLIPHLTGNLIESVQVDKNENEVHFCLMWGLSVFVLWIVFDNPWIAIIPPLFMAFGDGITGVARNLMYKRRTKSPIGNVFMLALCAPLGFFLAARGDIALWGLIAAVVASFLERYEFGPIDDNILITVSASLVLYIGHLVGPII